MSVKLFVILIGSTLHLSTTLSSVLIIIISISLITIVIPDSASLVAQSDTVTLVVTAASSFGGDAISAWRQ